MRERKTEKKTEREREKERVREIKINGRKREKTKINKKYKQLIIEKQRYKEEMRKIERKLNSLTF